MCSPYTGRRRMLCVVALFLLEMWYCVPSLLLSYTSPSVGCRKEFGLHSPKWVRTCFQTIGLWDRPHWLTSGSITGARTQIALICCCHLQVWAVVLSPRIICLISASYSGGARNHLSVPALTIRLPAVRGRQRGCRRTGLTTWES